MSGSTTDDPCILAPMKREAARVRRSSWAVVLALYLYAGCSRPPLAPNRDHAGTAGVAGHDASGAGGSLNGAAGVPMDANLSHSDGGTVAIDASAAIDDASIETATRPGTFAVSPLYGASVAYQVNPAHTGNQPTSKLKLPLTRAWSIDLVSLGAAVGAVVSYPLIVDGRIFVTFQANRGAVIEALDLQSGHRIWGPQDMGDSRLTTWANAAYDAGRVYVVNGNGLVAALDPATGATLWSKQMPDQYSISAPPTATGGMLFIGGAGEGGTIYAVDGASGEVVWKSSVAGGIDSSPAVTSDGVYVSYVCLDVYGFNPLGGSLLWRHQGSCRGGGGGTPAYYRGNCGFEIPWWIAS